MVELDPNVKETRQQDSQGLTRGHYMELDEARRGAHDFPKPLRTNTSQVSEYAPLHPSTLPWEISRQNVKIEKVIGKGAFWSDCQGNSRWSPRNAPGNISGSENVERYQLALYFIILRIKELPFRVSSSKNPPFSSGK